MPGALRGRFRAYLLGVAAAGLVALGGPIWTVDGHAPGRALAPAPPAIAGPRFPVRFSETGLPAGTSWSVTLGGTTRASNSSSIQFYVGNGTYAYSLGGGTGFRPNPSSGSVTVRGGNNTVVATIPLPNVKPWGAAFDPLNSLLYLADDRSANLSLINGTTHRVTGSVAVGGSPDTPLFDPATDRLYVANYLSNNVTVLDALTDAHVADVAVGSQPVAMALNPTNGLLYVTDGASNAVSVLNATTDAVVATVPTGSQPHGIAYDPDDGKMYVANWGSNDISVISGTPGRVASTVYLGNGTPSPAPFGVAFDSWNGGVYVTDCNGCAGTVLNGTTGAAGQFPTGPSPAFPTFDPENGLLYVPNAARSGSVTIVDGRTNAVLSTLPAGQNPITAAYDPDTGELYVPNYSGNTVTVIDGTAYDESVSFGAVSAPRYPVAFAENGLPAGSKWTVTLGGVTYVSSGGTVVASEPNGTYAFSVAPAGAYAPRPATGSVAVRGGPVSQTIGFAPRTHSVRFAESGLPAGHAWSVTFGTTSRTATGPSLAFAEANGSYSFQVRPEAGYTAIPARGTVRIDGQNLTVRVQFTPAGSPGTGGGQGSVSWPVWVGALGLPAWVLAAVVAVAVAVPLFFLARRRRRRSPTTVPPPDTDWSPGPGADDGASEAIATEGGPSLA